MNESSYREKKDSPSADVEVVLSSLLVVFDVQWSGNQNENQGGVVNEQEEQEQVGDFRKNNTCTVQDVETEEN